MAKVKQIKAIECPGCGDFFPEDDYEDHLTTEQCGFPEAQEAWQCQECDAIYDERDEAKECCDVG
jgi:hypothetical protein